MDVFFIEIGDDLEGVQPFEVDCNCRYFIPLGLLSLIDRHERFEVEWLEEASRSFVYNVWNEFKGNYVDTRTCVDDNVLVCGTYSFQSDLLVVYYTKDWLPIPELILKRPDKDDLIIPSISFAKVNDFEGGGWLDNYYIDDNYMRTRRYIGCNIRAIRRKVLKISDLQ